MTDRSLSPRRANDLTVPQYHMLNAALGGYRVFVTGPKIVTARSLAAKGYITIEYPSPAWHGVVAVTHEGRQAHAKVGA